MTNPTSLVKVDISVKLGNIWLQLVSLLILVILIPLELVELLLVLDHVLVQVLGKNISLKDIALSLLSLLSSKKSILTDQSKPVSPFMLIS